MEHGSYSRAVRRRPLRVLFCTVACLAALGMLPSVSYQLVFSRGLRGFLYEYERGIDAQTNSPANDSSVLVTSPNGNASGAALEGHASLNDSARLLPRAPNSTNLLPSSNLWETSSAGSQSSPEIQSQAVATNDKPPLSLNQPNSSSLPSIQDILPQAPEHPHAGARDPNGQYGYVADVTQVRKWIMRRYEQYRQDHNLSLSVLSQFSYMPFENDKEMLSICQVAPGKGFEGEAGWELLVDHISVGATAVVDNNATRTTNNGTITTKPRPPPSKGKILCVVYTYEGKAVWIRAITETWGWRCDGFFAASTKTVENSTSGVGFGAIDLPHLGKESYNTMWQKTRSIMGYLYDNYRNDYDYFYVCGDDTHLIVENLRAYLGVVEQEHGTNKAMLMGHHVRRQKRDITYVGGGAGYVLSKMALREFAEKALLTCDTDMLVSAEDYHLSWCMRQIGVELVDTADELHRQRFIGIDANWQATENPWETNSWLLNFYDLWDSQGHGKRWGKNGTSTQAVSFHNLKTPEKMKRHHAVLYKSCAQGTALGDAFAARTA
jgi:hypothetical protein